MKKKYLCFVLGALFCGVLPAQEAAAQARELLRISPDEAVERALKNNLSLASARVTNETKRRASNLSWNQFIPGVTIVGSLSADNGRVTNATPSSQITRQYPEMAAIPDLPANIDMNVLNSSLFVGGQIRASLDLSLAMFENMKRLKLDYETGIIAYEKAKLQL